MVAGPRQVGKTTLVQQVTDSMDTPIIYASADEPSLRNAEWIAQQWEKARYSIAARGAIIVLDEVQKSVGWFEAVKRMWDEDTYRNRNLKVIILGSAQLLVQRGVSVNRRDASR